jgi:hypothetical protein
MMMAMAKVRAEVAILALTSAAVFLDNRPTLSIVAFDPHVDRRSIKPVADKIQARTPRGFEPPYFASAGFGC